MLLKHFVKNGMVVMIAVSAMVFWIGCGSGNFGGGKFVKVPESYFEVKPADDKKSISITKYTGQGGINIIIPAKIQGMPVSQIGEEAFYESIITGVSIPEGVTEIGSKAFAGSTIANIKLPNSLTNIGSNAFSGCKALTSVVIPNGVKSIGNEAFYETDLTYIVSLNPTPPSASYSSLGGDEDVFLLVQANSIDAYRNADGWGALRFIGDIKTTPIKNGKLHGKVTMNNKDGGKRIGIYRDGLAHGKFEEFYKSGKLKATWSFVNGEPHGKLEVYYENGKLMLAGDFKNGKFDGRLENYYENGQRMAGSNFKDGIPHGKLEGYYESGKLRYVLAGFNNEGKQHGKFEMYYENGQLMNASNFKDGEIDGKEVFYHENGQLWVEVENGECKAYNENGQLIKSVHRCYSAYTDADRKKTSIVMEADQKVFEILNSL